MTPKEITKEQLIFKAQKLLVFSHTNFQNDFLATGKGFLFGETERYFFKYVDFVQFKEVRFFKQSKRVTVSKKRTQYLK